MRSPRVPSARSWTAPHAARGQCLILRWGFQFAGQAVARSAGGQKGSRESACGLVGCPARNTLETAFLNEALLDRQDVRLGIAKRVRRGVDRVVAEDEIVLV